MLFALKKILSALLLPPVSSIVLALFGLWLARYHRRTGNTLVVLSLLSVLVLSWPPVSDALVSSLERYPAVTPRQLPEAKVQAIVVLGGGADTVAPNTGWTCSAGAHASGFAMPPTCSSRPACPFWPQGARQAAHGPRPW
jgi:uncharacterized SAM-binding protein YcdF (DUF218 family)